MKLLYQNQQKTVSVNPLSQIKQQSHVQTKNIKNGITPLDLLTKMKKNSQGQFDQYIQNYKQKSFSLINQNSVKLKVKKNKKLSNQYQNVNQSDKKQSFWKPRYKTQNDQQLQRQLKSELQLELIQPKKIGVFSVNSKKKIDLEPLPSTIRKPKHPIYQENLSTFKKNNKKSENFGIRYLSVQKNRSSQLQRQKQNLSTDRKGRHQFLQQLQQKNSVILRSQQRQKQKSPPQLIQKIRQRIQRCKLAQLEQKENYQISPHFNSQRIIEIVNHFKKVWNLFEAIQKKQNVIKLIECVRDYILQQDGDASDLEELYISSIVKKQIKKVVFYERICMIILVQLIIYKKLYSNSNFSYIRSIMHDFLDFYFSIQNDLQSANCFFKSQNNSNPQKNIRSQGNTNKKQISNFMIIYDNKYKNSKNQNGLKSLRDLRKNKTDLRKSYINQNEKNIEIHEKSSKNILPSQIRRPKDVISSINEKLRLLFKHSRHLQKFVSSQFELFEKHNNNLLYYNLLEYFSYSLLGKDWSQWQIQFLQTCPSPYLHFQPQKKYTLLLDLDETLVHYKMTNQYKGEFLLRPYLFQFLQQLSKYFQLGIFTCSLPQYADLIIDHMNQIQFRLYRHHTIKINNQFVKDLSRIGRDMKRVILVDNIDHNFRLQKMNGIHIKSWYGDRKDDMLNKLSKELIKLAISNIDDVSKSNHRRVFL